MQVSNLEVWEAQAALPKLLGETWPVKTAFALARLSRRIKEPHTDIEQVRRQLIMQYGDKDEQGNVTVKPNGEQWPAFVKAHNELMAETVEVDVERITLPSDNGAHVTPQALMALEPFLDVQ